MSDHMYEVPGSRLREVTREINGLRTILAALVARQAKDGTARVVVTEEELSRVDLFKLRVVTEPMGGSVLLRYGDPEA